MTPDLDLLTWATEQAIAKRDAILEAHGEKEPTFVERAKAFVIAELKRRGPLSGEVLTDCCKLAGIKPENDKCFGAVLGGLSRAGLIVKAGYCERRKGHSCAGGLIWKLNPN